MIDRFFSWLAGKPMEASPFFIPIILLFTVLAKYIAGPDLLSAAPADQMLSGYVMVIGGIAAGSLIKKKEE